MYIWQRHKHTKKLAIFMAFWQSQFIDRQIHKYMHAHTKMIFQLLQYILGEDFYFSVEVISFS